MSRLFGVLVSSLLISGISVAQAQVPDVSNAGGGVSPEAPTMDPRRDTIQSPIQLRGSGFPSTNDSLTDPVLLTEPTDHTGSRYNSDGRGPSSSPSVQEPTPSS